MNVLSKITVKSLKRNRTRTIVTIIGIILSATMICAVTTFASSLINYGKECAIYTEGNWHTRQVDTKYNTYEDVLKDDKVEKATYMQQVGFSNSVATENESKPYIHVLGAGNEADDFLPIHITSGRYPENSSEIILPEHLTTDGAVNYKIGDTITLDIGDRILDGYSLTQSNPSSIYGDMGFEPSGEVFEKRETRTYTVVGYYNRLSNTIEDYSAPGYTAITIADSTPSADCMYDVYVRLNNPKDTEAFMAEHIFTESNRDLLVFSGVTMLESFTNMLYGLAAIIIVLIMLGSIALIYNAFSISVSERTKQFGLLSSIGATKKQIRHMILFEALTVSIIGIPIGIILGVAGIGVTLLFVGNTLGDMGIPVDLTISVSPISIILAVVIALLTVFISAWIPSKRATKVTAIEAIRQSADIKAKNKKIKTSKLISKLFGVPGVIANKHYKRNKKKYRTTVLSLFMSIVLFISASAFTEYLVDTVADTSHVSAYEIGLSVEPRRFTRTTPESLSKQIKSATGVTDVAYYQYTAYPANIDSKYLSDEGDEYIKTVANQYSENDFRLYLNFAFVDDDSFKALLKENGLSEELYMNPEKPLAVAVDGFSFFNPETEKQEKIYLLNGDDNFEVSITKGKEVPGYFYAYEYEDENGNNIVMYQKSDSTNSSGENMISFSAEEVYINETINVGKVTDEIPYFLGSMNKTTLIYPKSLASSVFEGFTGESINYNYSIKSDRHTLSVQKIKTILADCGITNYSLSDHAEEEESRRNSVLIIQVFAYGFVILISLIAAANVFNTISTNINLRRKEFAILKSIGMTRKDFNKMMNFECLLYGSHALLYGLPVSVLVTYLIYRSVANTVTMPFHLPWGAIGIAVLSVFLVVFVTMLYSMRKIKKDNPIDALKNENL